MSMIDVQNLNTGYAEHKVLHDVCFRIDKYQFMGIIGANGSGKTTLLKSISGYLRPSSGSIRLFGKDIQKYTIKERAKLIGYVPQDIPIDFQFRCYDIVMMGRFPYLRRFHSKSNTDRDIVEDCMKLTDTWNFKDKMISQLSGGERQRVFIARALAQNPRILLLDEPISHLDIKYQVEILSLLRMLAAKGILIIAILHDINQTSQFCDEIMILKAGRILAKGTPQKVITTQNIHSAFSIDIEVFTPPMAHNPYIIPAVRKRKKFKVV